MKKLLFAFLGCMFLTAGSVNASALFSMDETEFYSQLSDLTALDEFVEAQEGITLSAINMMNVTADSKVLNAIAGLTEFASFEPPLGIPSFLWGCVLGWVGILIVHLVADDRDETKKALIGCLIGSGVVILAYVIIWVVILGSAASTL